MSSTAAYITSVSRLFKSTTLTKGTLNELLSSKDWKELLSILKEKGILEENLDSVEKAEIVLRKKALARLQELYNLSNSVKLARDIVLGYIYQQTLDEFTYLVSLVWNKIKGDTSKLLYLQGKVDQIPSSMEELNSVLQGTIHGQALSFAMSKGPKDLSQLNSLLDYFFIYYMNSLTEGLKGEWKVSANSILCEYKDYYSASIAIRQKLNLGIRCRLNEDDIRDLSSSKSSEEITNILRRTVYSRNLDLSSIYSALASFHTLARSASRVGALSVFMGSPFNPIVAMGVSQLIRLDTEDLIMLLNGTKLGYLPERLKGYMSFQLI
ncbi:MAG: V-type ATPase subunit [Metallosphaera sp.]